MSVRGGRLFGWIGALLLVTGLAFGAGNAGKKKPAKPARPAAAASASVPEVPPGPKPLSETLSGDAKAHYDAAKMLYGDGDWEGALVKFRAAHDASKDARLLWNMAACEKSLRHYAKVLGLLKRYLEEGGALLTDQDKKDAKELLSAIEAFTSSLTLIVNEAGAEVVIDDEPIGTTPLPGPVVVDIGMRRVDVKKPGFRAYTTSMPVGGSKEVRQYIMLEKEVHEGRITIHAPQAAQIFLDGAPVGLGAWDGPVASGGHTLRVMAPGMRPYQSEVVVQDGDKRSIEVALEPLPQTAPPEEERGALHGFDLGLRTGYGSIDHSKAPDVAYAPLWFEIGYRFGRPTLLSLILRMGEYDRSGTCGLAVHGATPDSPADMLTRYAPTSCWYGGLGLELLFHTMPRTIVDPWFGFDFGFQHAEYALSFYDPLSRESGKIQAGGDFFVSGVQLGVDWRPNEHLGVGPYIHVSLMLGEDGRFSEQTSASQFLTNRVCTSGGPCNSEEDDGGHSSAGLNVLGGVRIAYTF